MVQIRLTLSRDYLLHEGLPPDRVIKTGSPMYEVVHYYLPKINASDVLERVNLSPNEYYLVSAHREENIDDSRQFENLIVVLNQLAESGRRVIVSTHPRTRKRIEVEQVSLAPRVELMKPFGLYDFETGEARAGGLVR